MFKDFDIVVISEHILRTELIVQSSLILFSSANTFLRTELNVQKV